MPSRNCNHAHGSHTVRPRALAIFTDPAAGEPEYLDLACEIRSSVQQAEAGFLGSAGGSQSGRERAQPSGDAERRPATITPGERHTGRHRATSGDWAGLIWELEGRGLESRHPDHSSNMLSIGGSQSENQLLSPHVARRRSRSAHVGSHRSTKSTQPSTGRTCVRLAARGLPLRRGAIPPF
jgi:hypothetical protein